MYDAPFAKMLQVCDSVANFDFFNVNLRILAIRINYGFSNQITKVGNTDLEWHFLLEEC